MTSSERQLIREELDANARLRAAVIRLKDDNLRLKNEVYRQRGRAEYWRDVAKKARDYWNPASDILEGTA